MDSIVERLPARGARSAGCPGTHGGQLGHGQQTYERRQPEQTVLHRVVREHLETFLAEARQRGGGEGLPRFVERELREFLTCGVMARGFASFRCDGCAREILVAFSCKGRGFCPSCCSRRMGELAAHLVDGVLGGLPRFEPFPPASAMSAVAESGSASAPRDNSTLVDIFASGTLRPDDRPVDG